MRNTAVILWILIIPSLLYAQSAEVGLRMELNRKYYQSHRENTIYLKVSIDTDDLPEEETSAPLNVALVVDRSGSMAGERIDQLRDSLVNFVGRLSGEDWVSLTVFGSSARTLIESTQIESLANPALTVQQIEAEGGAAPYEALNLAASQLRKNLNVSSMNRLIFLTDGRATSGPRESGDFLRLTESLSREGISITTIGLGEEFDEDLLKQMAEMSKGEFYFAERPEELASVFTDQVQRLGNLAAEDVELLIRFRNAVRPEEIMGREGEISGREVRVKLGPLIHNENPYVLVSALLPGQVSFLDQLEVANAELTYVPIDEVEQSPVKVEASVRTRFVDTSPLIWKTLNMDVVYSVIEHDIAESMREAIAFADEGDPEKAVRELERTFRDLRSLNYELEDSAIESWMKELEQLIGSLNSRGLNRIDRKVMTLKVFQAIQQRTSGTNEVDLILSEGSSGL